MIKLFKKVSKMYKDWEDEEISFTIGYLNITTNNYTILLFLLIILLISLILNLINS